MDGVKRSGNPGRATAARGGQRGTPTEGQKGGGSGEGRESQEWGKKGKKGRRPGGFFKGVIEDGGGFGRKGARQQGSSNSPKKIWGKGEDGGAASTSEGFCGAGKGRARGRGPPFPSPEAEGGAMGFPPAAGERRGPGEGGFGDGETGQPPPREGGKGWRWEGGLGQHVQNKEGIFYCFFFFFN